MSAPNVRVSRNGPTDTRLGRHLRSLKWLAGKVCSLRLIGRGLARLCTTHWIVRTSAMTLKNRLDLWVLIDGRATAGLFLRAHVHREAGSTREFTHLDGGSSSGRLGTCRCVLGLEHLELGELGMIHRTRVHQTLGKLLVSARCTPIADPRKWCCLGVGHRVGVVRCRAGERSTRWRRTGRRSARLHQWATRGSSRRELLCWRGLARTYRPTVLVGLLETVIEHRTGVKVDERKHASLKPVDQMVSAHIGTLQHLLVADRVSREIQPAKTATVAHAHWKIYQQVVGQSQLGESSQAAHIVWEMFQGITAKIKFKQSCTLAEGLWKCTETTTVQIQHLKVGQHKLLREVSQWIAGEIQILEFRETRQLSWYRFDLIVLKIELLERDQLADVW
mmetsp:Transcript_18577/g.47223  ORF Transcript_18577/g.47223 Transcript_18577/m.47223 type:complete len:391 (+) Transcript_18577:691-1863(+)